MLLMDSLGGTAKALMIACISPSVVYFEETISTLNYATRTMNIKNKPVVQVDLMF
jgi:kinesin family protein 12